MAKSFSLDDWDYLSDEAGLIPVQEGGAGVRRQPGPTVVPIPGNAPRSAAPRQVAPPVQAQPAPQPATPAPKLDEFDYFGDATKPVEQPKAPAAPPSPYAEKDADTWLGRRWQDIRGKQDPRYKDLPTLVDTGAVPLETDAQAKLAMPGDEAYADILMKSLGGRFKGIEKDANGYAIVNYLDEKGQPQKAYVNKPGLDWQDIDRGISGAMPFVAGGGLVGKVLGKAAAPLIVRAPVQALTAGAVSGAQDAAAAGMGSEQGFDAPKAIGAMAGGVLGEVAAPAIGAAWRKLVTEPSLFNRSTGQLTEKGMEAARAAGLDPTDIPESVAREFAKQFAKSSDEVGSAALAGSNEWNVPITAGQIAKDRAQLSMEQSYRSGARGRGAADAMKSIDDAQTKALNNAVFGEIEASATAPPRPGLARTFAPDRYEQDYKPKALGIGVGERLATGFKNANELEDQAWKAVPKLFSTPEAAQELESTIAKRVMSSDIDWSKTDSITPYAKKMGELVRDFIDGKAPVKGPIGGQTMVADVDHVRRKLLAMKNSATINDDRRLAGQIYRAYDEWIGQAAEKAFLQAETGDAVLAAAKLAQARSTTAKLHADFFGEAGSRGGAIMKKLVEGKIDKPEEMLAEIFSPSKGMKNGGIEFLAAVKRIADPKNKYLSAEEGQWLLGDMKLAHLLQVVTDKTGGLKSPNVLLKDLQQSMRRDESLWQSLYSESDRRMTRSFIDMLQRGPTFTDKAIRTNPGTADQVATHFRDFLMSLWGGIGGNLHVAKMATSGVRGISGRVGAENATNPALRARNPRMIGPYGAAGGAEAYRDK